MSRLFEKKHVACVNTAFSLFLEHGFARTSMDAVAEGAGVSKATVYNHFKDKHALFEEVMALHCRSLMASLSFVDKTKNETLEKKLLSFAQALVNALLQPRSIALMRVVIFECGQFADLGAAIWRDGKLPLQNDFIVLLEEAIKQGQLCAMDTKIGARQFFGLIKENLVWPTLMGVPTKHSAEHSEKIIDEAVKMFLNYYDARSLKKTRPRKMRKIAKTKGAQMPATRARKIFNS